MLLAVVLSSPPSRSLPPFPFLVFSARQVPKSPVNVADNTAVQPGSPLAITAGGEPPSSPNMAGAIVPVYSPTGGPKALAEISETQLQTLMNALRQEREPQVWTPA